MTRIVYVEPDGQRIELDVANGWSVMQGATVEGVEGIEAECGGLCSCATCHCYVGEAWLDLLPLPSENEEVMLQNVAAERRPNSRLSCQLQVKPELDGMTITIPERQN
jgi:ferredoxin, 2Fe-2S